MRVEEVKDKVEFGRLKFNLWDKGDFRVRIFVIKFEEKFGNVVVDSNLKKIICVFCKNNYEFDLCEKFF